MPMDRFAVAKKKRLFLLQQLQNGETEENALEKLQTKFHLPSGSMTYFRHLAGFIKSGKVTAHEIKNGHITKKAAPAKQTETRMVPKPVADHLDAARRAALEFNLRLHSVDAEGRVRLVPLDKPIDFQLPELEK